MDDSPFAPDSDSPVIGSRELCARFDAYRGRLRAAVALRIDRRIAARLDPSDVLQETWLEATSRYHEYILNPRLPPYLWLRFLAMQRLLMLHRQHLQVRSRNASLEIPIDAEQLQVSSAGLAAQLIDSGTSPSEAADRAEDFARVQTGLNQLNPQDREILALRHFEHMTNVETARVLDVSEATASQRYYHALHRLERIMTRDREP